MNNNNNLNAEERESLKQAFSLYDRDGDGTIAANEFADILKSLNVGANDKDISEIIQSVDRNKDGRVDFEEFVHAMTRHLGEDKKSRQQQPPQRSQSYPPSKRCSFHEDDELEQCFKAFDKNGDGYISIQELKEVMTRLGENLNEHELKEMMEEADTNHDGQIDYKEFKKLIPPS
ncbi:hypothetical protein O0I10_006171 [Lichtheimia ornata]|uniref:EF-hand domain-containing protein n=1 Tax=Lichtheimia ornata TaxID=688661 RepID=A0AAD7V2J1_9FUNG|nr:uncharacterized protein O0I10_006171 [Lichtheimia ornata]KAJ8658164.1 hypothetical protein O0I10_006171 [Lichtheimia ornata]